MSNEKNEKSKEQAAADFAQGLQAKYETAVGDQGYLKFLGESADSIAPMPNHPAPITRERVESFRAAVNASDKADPEAKATLNAAADELAPKLPRLH